MNICFKLALHENAKIRSFWKTSSNEFDIFVKHVLQFQELFLSQQKSCLGPKFSNPKHAIESIFGCVLAHVLQSKVH